MHSEVMCPLCQSVEKQDSVFHDKLRYSHPGKIYKCLACEFVFLHPRLSSHELEQYYSRQYRDDYEDLSVDQRFQHDASEAQRRLDQLKIEFPEARSLLEIGSGSGAFLSLAHRHFSRAVGIELDTPAQKFLRDKGLSVYSDLNELKHLKFDLIVLFHVLEHLLDPVGFLENLASFLNEGGSIIVEVPNIEDALVSFYNINDFKDFYFCSAHVSYFSSKTLQDCFRKAGLVGHVQQLQRYDLANHLNWLKYKKPGTLPESEQIFGLQTTKAYEEDLRTKGISDTLWGVLKSVKN